MFMFSAVRKFIFHIILLFVSVAFPFFWTKSFLADYTLQLTALLSIFYFIYHLLIRKRLVKHKLAIDITVLALVVFLIIFNTGALFSPLFFLIYFLLFGISLLFEPASAIALSIIAIFFFLLTPKREFFVEFLQLISLLLITPLATVFGKQYLKLLENEEKIKILEIEEKALEAEVKTQEEQVKGWTYGDFRERLGQISKDITLVSKDPSLKLQLREVLQKAINQINSLFESGKKMEKEVEQ